MQSKLTANLSKFALRPSVKEVRDTHILYLARHATDMSPEQVKRHGYSVTADAIILKTLRDIGFKVTAQSELEALFDRLDFDFIFSSNPQTAFEGHELLYAAIAAYRGIPFIGAPAPFRALAEDKILGKHVAASIGLEVAEHHLIDPARPEMADFSLPGRWIIKPRGGYDSISVILVDDEAAWRDAIKEAANPRHEGRKFFAEAFIPGLNFTVPVIEGFPPQSFAVFEERGRKGDNILDQAGKTGHAPTYSAEPYFGPGAEEASAAAAIAPFDYGRFDFRYDPDAKRLVFLEVNIVCAMGPATVLARAAALRGINYPSLVGHLVTQSLRHQRRRTASKASLPGLKVDAPASLQDQIHSLIQDRLPRRR